MFSEYFARVENGVVTNFPLTLTEINTNYPDDDYIVECYDSEIPVFNASLERLVPTPVVVGDNVMVLYSVIDKTVEDLFAELIPLAPTDISTIPPMLLNALVVRTKERVQISLDNFAKTKGYDSIASCVSYKASITVTYSVEGTRAEELRDSSWTALNNYLNNVMTGVSSIPVQWSDIESQLPILTW